MFASTHWARRMACTSTRSGGVGRPVDAPLLVRVTGGTLDPSEALAFVADPGAGGTVLFTGTVREHSEDGAVTALEYEAWEEKAAGELRAIGEEMLERWAVRRAAL